MVANPGAASARGSESRLSAYYWLAFLVFGLGFLATAHMLERSDFAREAFSSKVLFAVLLWTALFRIFHFDKDVARHPDGLPLLLAVGSLAMTGVVAWYQFAGIPNLELAQTGEGHDAVRYEYWGMYLAQVWLDEGFRVLPLPFSQPGICYVWALVYLAFGFDPHLTVLLNGFFYTLIAFVAYKVSAAAMGAGPAVKVVLVFVALLEGFWGSAASWKDPLVTLLFLYGLYRAFLVLRGKESSGYLWVGLCALGLVAIRVPVAVFYLVCIGLGVLLFRQSFPFYRVCLVGFAAAFLALPAVFDVLPFYESGTPLGEATSGSVYRLATSSDRVAPEEGSALRSIGGSLEGWGAIFIPLRGLAFLMDGSVNVVFRSLVSKDSMKDAMDWVGYTFLASAMVMAFSIPFIFFGLARSLRSKDEARLFVITLVLGTFGMAAWLSGVMHMRYRYLLLPLVAFAVVYGYREANARQRALLSSGSVLLFFFGVLMYEILKG